jgi:hypothetical protein
LDTAAEDQHRNREQQRYPEAVSEHLLVTGVVYAVFVLAIVVVIMSGVVSLVFSSMVALFAMMHVRGMSMLVVHLNILLSYYDAQSRLTWLLCRSSPATASLENNPRMPRCAQDRLRPTIQISPASDPPGQHRPGGDDEQKRIAAHYSSPIAYHCTAEISRYLDPGTGHKSGTFYRFTCSSRDVSVHTRPGRARHRARGSTGFWALLA